MAVSNDVAPTGASGKRSRPSRRVVLGAAAGATALAAASTVAVAAGTGALFGPGTCTIPALPGAVVEVAAVDMAHMNGGMMGDGSMKGGTSYGWGTMRLYPSTSTVPAGTVSFLLRNAGTRSHELLVLPLTEGASAGARQTGSDRRVDETGNLGEASRSCGAGEGGGIRARSAGWVTLQLRPGRYELLCNETGHYTAGMWADLTVT
jgi:uncharacterized cupredoxin-like copper-binding protein